MVSSVVGSVCGYGRTWLIPDHSFNRPDPSPGSGDFQAETETQPDCRVCRLTLSLNFLSRSKGEDRENIEVNKLFEKGWHTPD